MVTLEASFNVPLAVAGAWELLQDAERVARWFPGATLEDAEGDTFTGTVRVKLGPMVIDYHGTASFTERDERAHRLIMKASGREQRGSGMATATAVTQLASADVGTDISVSVKLDISGRPAQLGQSMLHDVGERLVEQFAERMRVDLLRADGESQAEPSGESSNAVNSGEADTDVLDLGRVAVPALIRRVVPLAAVAALVALWWWLRGRRAATQ